MTTQTAAASPTYEVGAARWIGEAATVVGSSPHWLRAENVGFWPWVRRWWRRMGNRWCRRFHRRHHVISGVDSLRSKAQCACCGRKFLLERHAF